MIRENYQIYSKSYVYITTKLICKITFYVLVIFLGIDQIVISETAHMCKLNFVVLIHKAENPDNSMSFSPSRPLINFL